MHRELLNSQMSLEIAGLSLAAYCHASKYLVTLGYSSHLLGTLLYLFTLHIKCVICVVI